jgi:N-acetylneuraminic acid mutarotase
VSQFSIRSAAVCILLSSWACGTGQTTQGISLGGGGSGSISPTLVEGDPNPASVNVTLQNGSGCEVSYTASAVTVEDPPWLAVGPQSGGIPVNGSATLTLFLFSGLAPGNHQGAVTINGTCVDGRVATGSPVVIAVNLRVVPASGLSAPGNVPVDGVTLANSWTPLDAGTDPQAEHKAIWTGNAVAIYGGSGNFGIPAAGAFFDPRAGGWQQIPSSPFGPSPRSHGAVVWSGRTLIVFGGDFFGTAMGDGAEYDPTSNFWSFLPGGFSAPSARTGMAAVWAAGQMLIFGGRNGTSYFSDTFAYSRFSGWSQMSFWFHPSGGRAFPISVWTGRRMLVWGGIAPDGTMLADGGEFDPMTNTWTPMPSTSTPSLGAASAWSGSHLLVWGGAAPGGSPVNTGARFDGFRSAWSPMSTVGAPSPREGAAGAWTGSRFVVFGGRGADGNVLSDGGIYDPETDTWTPLSLVSAPGPRWHHSATWTGSEMVFIGGSDKDGFNFFADGGILR